LALTRAAPEASSSIGVRAKASDLRLEVDGIGQVSLPVSATQAAQLCDLARPARFGRGEHTLTDRRVRDTWEVPQHLVTPTWSPAFDAALEKVRAGLGLPPSARLSADLHSLLVYEPGQFFVTHQDSEKHDAMVATLVVVLPSAHAGGELVVHQGGQATSYKGSKTAIAMAAFYADCRHEVLPVTSGQRIALTYNLSLDGGERADSAATDDATIAELARLLDAHFTTPQRAPYSDRELEPPIRLVYLLDHEYTARGLSWSRLKGADARRVTLLKAAAERAGCEVTLALAEIQETWDALEPDYRYSRRR
jgi:sarcosine oxidase gamma subunit